MGLVPTQKSISVNSAQYCATHKMLFTGRIAFCDTCILAQVTRWRAVASYGELNREGARLNGDGRKTGEFCWCFLLWSPSLSDAILRRYVLLTCGALPDLCFFVAPPTERNSDCCHVEHELSGPLGFVCEWWA